MKNQRIYAFTHLCIYAFMHLRIYAFTHFRIYALKKPPGSPSGLKFLSKVNSNESPSLLCLG
jgi:hypothetical protein